MNAPSNAHDFLQDIDAIGRSAVIPTLLETIVPAIGMGFAAVARVIEARWITCSALDNISFGLTAGDELVVETTLCHEVRQFDQEIVIDDVNNDPTYAAHHCPARYGFRSYISVPIRRANGSFFGTHCAIDPNPFRVKDERVLAMFRLFAKMIGEIRDADEKLLASKDASSHERGLAHAQEQFIAILAHDLRNPINALSSGCRLIERRNIDAETIELVGLMRASVNRMGLLIENLLDQARKRSGGGIVFERRLFKDLGPALHQICAELRTVTPDQPIEMTVELPNPVSWDVACMSQLFSNLLGNAVTHGASGKPIKAAARLVDNDFILTVANSGDRIPEELLPTIFMPFERTRNRFSREGTRRDANSNFGR